VAGRIIWAWIFTIPASALVASLVYGLTHAVVNALGG
jgi:PiT family inorganic phosphate transporter